MARSLLKAGRRFEEVERLLAGLDADTLETASPERNWAPRLDLLRGELLVVTGRAAEALTMIEPALQRLRDLGSAQAEVLAAEKRLHSLVATSSKAMEDHVQ